MKDLWIYKRELGLYKGANTKEKIINFLVNRMSSWYKTAMINWERFNEAEMCLRVLNNMR